MTTRFTEREAFIARIVSRAWKDSDYRSRLLDDPKGVLAEELGTDIPAHVEVHVLEEHPDVRYLLLPHQRDHFQALTENELAAGRSVPVCPTVTSTAITSPCDCG
ncbi:NHLP leader peptide family natural product precursor [Actinomadura sp. KC345]|uniref:NHLP leader peptide family RiPP precursor n=1 Tax=Actinomadura sp. KC345 TaxID=2530371 RepID=UPI0010495F9E|nr:NHLP leader peptide family RiPP precursor [Actinomadura sp. KC345]TDC52495.1 NHLP leader peptide family natural product precursor [Actinomadura sp. KC345]